MPETDTHAPRRRWPYVVGALIGLFLVMAILFMRDDPRGDHSDLAPTRAGPTAASAAAFRAWMAAFAKMDEDVIHNAIIADPNFYDRLDGRQAWVAAPVEKIITANRAALDDAAVAAALGHFTLPPIERFDQRIPHLSERQSMAKLLRIYAVERQVAGAFGEAGDAVQMGLQFGDNCALEANLLIDYLVGVTCQAIALAGAEQLIVAETPYAELARLDTLLRTEPDMHAALAEAYRREFAVFANSIEHFEELDPNVNSCPEGQRLPELFLRKNRTINKRAEGARLCVSSAALPPKQRVEPEKRKANLFSSNALGERLLSNGSFEIGSIAAKADIQLAQRRMLRLKIALLRHHRDEGSLPATLAELVPRYIDAIPADPHDGAAVRYDAARGAVWVLGKDLADGGGSAALGKRGFSSKDPDPTVFVIHPPPAP